MGNIDIAVKSLLKQLGWDYIVPPDNSQKTLDLGVKHAPEGACLPLKVTLGNFIEALENGADTLLMVGGFGPCRLGYYCEVQREILKNLGYDFEMIILDPDFKKLFRQYRKYNVSLKDIFRGLWLAYRKIEAIDQVNSVVAKTRAKEIEDGIADELFDNFLKQLDNTESVKKIKQLKENYQKKLLARQGAPKRGLELKIGIVGEIYMVIDSFSNLELEKRLGQLGAEIEREIYVSSWLKHYAGRNGDQEVKKLAEPYLQDAVGGHAVHSVGDTIKYARQGFEGVVHVGPFTCMPELVADTILPQVEKEENISVLTLFMDEQRGEAGVQTRLEAFVDLLLHKKKAEKVS